MFKRVQKRKTLRIGVYAGTFNPVHVGHIAFALQAIKAGKLDKVYFLPERRPRHKTGVEHFGHRVAMLKAAVRPHPQLGVMELQDISFSVQGTLPRLQQRFRGSQLVFLFGSDVVPYISDWPLADRLLVQSEIIIGLRQNANRRAIEQLTKAWNPAPKKLLLLKSHAPDVSSHKVREALRARRHAKGLLRSVAQYSNRNWLYVSLAQNNS